jgi:predicted HTH domain antitoxin
MVLELDDLLNNDLYSEKDFRLDMAITLYQRKVASLTRLAKLAGLSKSAFEVILIEKGLLQKETKPLTANERMLASLPADHPLRPYIKSEPIRKNVTAEQLMREQNYKGTDWDKLNAIAKAMAIEEPIELLLAQAKD